MRSRREFLKASLVTGALTALPKTSVRPLSLKDELAVIDPHFRYIRDDVLRLLHARHRLGPARQLIISTELLDDLERWFHHSYGFVVTDPEGREHTVIPRLSLRETGFIYGLEIREASEPGRLEVT